MNKRQEQKEETLRRILEASLELFVKNGYHGTTTRDIAAAAGVSPGLMFHYFPTKEALYTEILSTALDGVQWATGIGKRDDADTPEGAVVSSIPETGNQVLPIFEKIADTIILNCRDRTPAVFVLVKQAQTGNFATDEMKRIIGRMNAAEALVPLIAAGQRSGEIRQGDPHALSACFFSAIQGIAENAYCYPDTPLPDGRWLTGLLCNPGGRHRTALNE